MFIFRTKMWTIYEGVKTYFCVLYSLLSASLLSADQNGDQEDNDLLTDNILKCQSLNLKDSSVDDEDLVDAFIYGFGRSENKVI
jgi:hypothetical protein